MAVVSGRRPDGKETAIIVVARGDRVLVRVGTGEAISLSTEQPGDLLQGLRAEFEKAACALLDTLRPPPTARRAARPNTEGGPPGSGGPR